MGDSLSNLEHVNVTVNSFAGVRRETLYGRSYLVAPMSLLVPGVLNGSQGPLYYPPDEVYRDPSAWNHTPIVLRHPTFNGAAVSAKDPRVLDKHSLGLVFNAVGNSTLGKLTAEGWFDEELVKRTHAPLLDALTSGQSVELSTGLFLEQHPAPPNSVHNAKDGTPRPYLFVARSYKPDHLAILPDEVGACSIADGCGVLVNSAVKNETDKVGIWTRLGNLLGITGNSKAVDTTSLEPARSTNNSDNIPPVSTASQDTIKINPGDMSMALTANQRKEIVDHLVANCDCWKHQGDREVLNSFSDDKLAALKEHADREKEREAVANAARKGFTEPSSGTVYTYNAATGRWESRKEDTPLVASGSVPSVAVGTTMNPNPSSQQVATMHTNTGNAAPTSPPPTSRLTPEEQEDLAFARAERNRQKQAVVNQLVANIQDPTQKQAKATSLLSKSLPELQEILSLMPSPPATNAYSGGGDGHVAYPTPVPTYHGSAVPLPSSVGTQPQHAPTTSQDDDILPIPTVNWDQWAKEDAAQLAQTAS